MQIYQNVRGDLRVALDQFVEGLRRHPAVVHQAGVFLEGVLQVLGLLGRQLRLVRLLDHFFDKSVHIIIAAHFIVPANVQRSRISIFKIFFKIEVKKIRSRRIKF